MRFASDAAFQDLSELVEIVSWLSVSARLDLAITLCIYMMDSVDNYFGENGEHIAALREALKVFLANWFTEQMCGTREEAVSCKLNYF